MAVVFHRGAFSELGCDHIWNALPGLVRWSKKLVEVAICGHLVFRGPCVRHFLGLGETQA